MTTSFAVSPANATYAQTVPYLTLAEFKAAPTAVDTTSLILGGTQQQQNQALIDTIARASGWADTICSQSLACTVDVESGRYRVDRDGYINVPLHNRPILEVRGVQLGTRASELVALTDFSDVQVMRSTTKIPVFPLNTPAGFGLNGGWGIGARLLTEVTYVNGWVNTTTVGDVVSGATSLVVASALGIYAGTQLVLSDGASTEVVTVASAYQGGPGASTTIPLVSALQNAHTSGTSANNLPQVVKQAVILLTCVLIRTRGDDAIILDSTENPSRVSDGYGSSAVDVATATGLLHNLIRSK